MPFTFSHPAIVLPLKKLSGANLSLTGLVIGSMTPDFEYFIRMRVKSSYSHTIPGLFWYDLPLGLLLTFIYHLIVRDQLLTNLPASLNGRFKEFKHFEWITYFKKNWLIVVISILIGVASHLFWDDFTHPAGYFVKQFANLRKEVNWKGMRIPFYNILQQLSSLVGAMVMIYAMLKMKNNLVAQSNRKYRYWLYVSIIMLIVFLIWFFTGMDLHLYGDVIVTLISAFLTGLIITPLIFRLLSTVQDANLVNQKNP